MTGLRSVRWLRAGAATVLLVVTSWTMTGAAAVAAPGSQMRTVLNDAHTDTLHLEYTDGRLVLNTRVGSEPYQFYDPSAVIFQVRDNDASRLAVPDMPEYAFLGPAGSPLWLVPQVQDPSLLFAGWDTESLPVGALSGDAVDIHLRGVSGPGAVEIFQNDGVGLPLRVFSSADPGYKTLHQGIGQHVHANWSFTALGRYTLTFEVTATTAQGAPLSTGRLDYTWYVGGTNPQDITAEPSSTTLSAASGPQGVVLSATVAPARAQGWVEFFDGGTSLGHADVNAGSAAFVTQALSPGVHTVTARFIPLYGNDFVASVSAPVTHTVTGGPPVTTTTTTSKPSTTTPPVTTSSKSPPVATTTTTSCVPSTSPAGVVLDNGHVDYAARIVDGRLVSQVKDGTSGVPRWRPASEVVLHLKPDAATTVPSDAFAFLGPASTRIWQIPQTQKPGILWLGWNTEEIAPAQATGGVTWQLASVSGPGSLAIYELDPFGKPVVIFNSKDGLPDNHSIRLGTHAHGNWAFTAPGAYRVTFVHSLTLTSGATVSDKQTVTFAVGDTDPKPLLPTKTTGCGGGVGGDNAVAARLASTGASIGTPLAIGGALVLVGAVLLVRLRAR